MASNTSRLTNLHKNLLVCLVLAIITALAYWPVHDFDFVNIDDYTYVKENPHVTSGFAKKNILWAFTTNYASNYHPLTWLSHMLDCQLFGLDPGSHHLVNLMFHIANSMLLFVVIRIMTKKLWQSFLVAALFAWHPLHVESVAWIAERKDVLSTFFCMITIWFYIQYVQRPGVIQYLKICFSFLFGLMAKSMLVTLPFVLILLDFWPLNRINIFSIKNNSKNDSSKITFSRCIMEKAPLFLLSIIFSILTLYAQKQGGSISSIHAVPIDLRISNALVAYIAYIGKFIWPQNLTIMYLHPGSYSWLHIMSAGICLSIVSMWVVLKSNKSPYLLVGWFWYLGTLVPVIGIVQVGLQSMADRYTYIPLIGIFIMVTWGISEFLDRRPRVQKMAICLIVGLLMMIIFSTYRQVLYWENSFTLFQHALSSTENNYLAHNNMGTTLQRSGQLDKAEHHYRKALKIKPDYLEALINLGNILQNKGFIHDAIKYYVMAKEIEPNHVEIYYNLGNAQRNIEALNDALESYQNAIRIDPEYENAHNNLASVLNKLGDTNQAIEHCKKAIRINPDFFEAHNNLGFYYSQSGQPELAIEHFLEAIRINNEYEIAYDKIGLLLKELKRFEESIEFFKKAIMLNPDFKEAYNNLGLALVEQGKLDEAIKKYLIALKLDNEFFEVHNNLGNALQLKDQYNNAVDHYTIALQHKPDSVEILNNLGNAFQKLNRFQMAIDNYSKALSIQPNSAAIYNNLGQAYAKIGDIEKAINCFKDAIRLKPDYLLAKNNLKQALSLKTIKK